MKYNIKISLRALKQILKDTGLKRKNIIESPLELIGTEIYAEVQSTGLCIGYRAMWQRLRFQYGFTVKCATVLKLINIIDPV